MKNCAGCGAPPNWDDVQCLYCARPNETHPSIARYVTQPLGERRWCGPMRTNMPAPRVKKDAFTVLMLLVMLVLVWP